MNLRSLGVLSIVGLGLSACVQAEAQRPGLARQAPASDSAAVVLTLNGFLRAFERLEWDPFRAAFADDASVFFPSATTPERYDGRAAIETRFQQEFATIRAAAPGGPPFMQLRPEHLRIQVVAPGAVVATFELRNAQRIARRTFVFRHDPAGWRIVHLQASNVPWPDSPAPSRGGA